MDISAKSNWTSKSISYLKNVVITEYDMKDGGLSVIREYGLLKQDIIDKLISIEKQKRNIIIGKLQAKFPELAKNMVLGFGYARQEFVNNNGISDTHILSIKKDAIFLINCHHINTQVGSYINFRPKNQYTSYINIERKEFYYSAYTNDLVVKGISDEVREKQKDYLLRDIKIFLKQAEKVTKDVLFASLKEYRRKYLSRELPIETYRNLDSGLFTLNDFELSDVGEKDLENIDISYNYIHYVLPVIQNMI